MLTALDIVVLVLLGGGLLLGAIKGFVAEALSLLAWFAAVFVLKLGFAPVTKMLTGFTGSYYGAAVLAFLLVFGTTFFLFRLAATALGRRTRQSVLGPVDRMLGRGFGALKGLIAATLLFLGGNLFADLVWGGNGARPEWARFRSARAYPLLNASSQAVLGFVRHRRERTGAAGADAGTTDRSAEEAR